MGSKKGSDRITEFDRQQAMAQIEFSVSQGVITGDQERRAREDRVRVAVTQDDIAAAIAGLPPMIGGRGGGGVRISDAERQEAVRLLELHGTYGTLTSAEVETRSRLARAAMTPNDVKSIFADLPELGPSGPVRGQLISQSERANALAALQEAMRDGRIGVDDYVNRKMHVEAATDRSQLNQAFAGLPDPKVSALVGRAAATARDTTTKVGRATATGAKRAVRGVVYVAAIGACLAIALVAIVVTAVL